MKEIDKKKIPNNNQSKRAARTERRDNKLHQDKANKNLDANSTESKASHAKPDSTILVSDLNVGREPSEVYENMVVHYMDDAYRSEETSQDLKVEEMAANGNKDRMSEAHSTDLEKESKQGNEGDSDIEARRDSVSSYGDSLIAEDEKVEMAKRVPKSLAKKNTSEDPARAPRRRSDRETNKSKPKAFHNAPKKSNNSGRGPRKLNNESTAVYPSKNKKVPSNPPSESSEGVDDKSVEEEKEVHHLDEASNGTQIVCSDDETVDGDGEENGEHENKEDLDRKIEEMESRVEKLEEELREVAALEISLYSIVAEHGSSSHKVHTPARRLSRLYLHACKHWTQNKRATIAKNTVSGLVLVAKSCGNDVPRLTFWLSNMVVLREIISQALGSSCQSSSVTKFAESNGVAKRNEAKSASLKWKGNSGGRQASKPSLLQFVDDWQETRTFTAALEKVECWIFSRIVESVWWQTLTPHMQSPVEDLHTPKSIGRLLGPALGDQQQGGFSINLWKNAFQDAFQRLCPVRAGGHECGCLPILARMVMEQCVARLDVAMFNAILRESAHEIPTDPVSDPIVDSKVLPIPAGDLSFGSGAQLKNSVGTWSRWLSDMFGMDSEDTVKKHGSSEDDDRHGGDAEPKSFLLLNSLSDLLMLPKDMLMDRSIRQEVCPSIGLPMIKRILCNFTPDEFCPDPVPGVLLELLNAEGIAERMLLGDSSNSFPCQAAPVVYVPPSPSDVAEKVGETGGSQMVRNASIIQRKGYTSDEELEEMDSPLTSTVDKLPTSPTVVANGNGNGIHKEPRSGINIRYELLREVWSM